MKRTFYLGRKEYTSFESAYVLGKFNAVKNFNIRSYIGSKRFSNFVWNEEFSYYVLTGIKHTKQKEMLLEKINLYDCYKDIVKNAKKYFSEYDKLSITKIGESSPILIVDIDYLEVLITVIKVLDKNNAKYSLDDLTDNYLNPNIDDIKKERANHLEAIEREKEEAKLEKERLEREKLVKEKLTKKIEKEIKIKDIISDTDKVSLSEKEIMNLTTFKTPLFQERKIINKDYWVEIRLKTSTIVDKTESGDWKSTSELYHKLRKEFPNKEIALVKNNDGTPFDCFKSSAVPSDISVDLVLKEYRNILNSINNIRNMKTYAEEEANIKNREGIVSSHIIENSSFFTEDDFKKAIISEKCRLDDRRDIKTLMEVSKFLPDENKMEEIIVESLKAVKERLDSYFKNGENYLNNNAVNDTFNFKDEEDFQKIYLEKKNKYKIIKKSNFNKRIHCFSGNDRARKEG